MNNKFKKSLVALALAGVASVAVAQDDGSNRGNAQPLFGEVHVSTQYQNLVNESGTEVYNAVAAADFIVVLDREYSVNDEIVFEFNGAEALPNSMPEEISFNAEDAGAGYKGMTIGILNRRDNSVTYRVTDLVGSTQLRTTGLAVNFSMRNGGWDGTNTPSGSRPGAQDSWNAILKGGGNRDLQVNALDYRPATFDVASIQPDATVTYTMYQGGNRDTVLDQFTEGLFKVRSQINPLIDADTPLDGVVDVYEDRRQFVCGTYTHTPDANTLTGNRSTPIGNTGQNGDCGATGGGLDNTFAGEYTNTLVLNLSGFNGLETGFNRGVYDIQNVEGNRTLINQTPTYLFASDWVEGVGEFSNRNAGYFAYLRSARYTVQGDFRWLRSWMDNNYPAATESVKLGAVFGSVIDVSCENAPGFADRPQQAAAFGVSNDEIYFTCGGWGEPIVEFDLENVVVEGNADFTVDHIPTNDFSTHARLAFDLDINNGRGAYVFDDLSQSGHIDRDDAIYYVNSNTADAGEWTINGHQTFVPFMPISGDAEAVVVLTNIAKEHSSSAVAENREVLSEDQRYTDPGYGLVEVTVTDSAGNSVLLEEQAVSSQGVVDISDLVNGGVAAAVSAGDLEGGQFALEIFVASADSDVQVYTAYRTAEGETFVQNDSLHIREVRERSRQRGPQTGRDGYSAN